MQHPPELIPQMISKWQEGYDIIYTLRQESKDESFFKNFSSKYFCFLINKLADIKIKPGAADYRLMDRKVEWGMIGTATGGSTLFGAGCGTVGDNHPINIEIPPSLRPTKI